MSSTPALGESSDNPSPVMKQDRAETALNWGFVVSTIAALGLLAAAGYFGYTSFSHGLNMLHSIPFVATYSSGIGTGLLALALRVGACCRSRSVMKAEQAHSEDENRKQELDKLSEDSEENYTKTVLSLTKEEYGTLLEKADASQALAKRLAKYRPMLIAHLSTARTLAVCAVAAHLMRHFSIQFATEIKSATFSENTEQLRININALSMFFTDFSAKRILEEVWVKLSSQAGGGHV